MAAQTMRENLSAVDHRRFEAVADELRSILFGDDIG
jgi:hypothetical protein